MTTYPIETPSNSVKEKQFNMFHFILFQCMITKFKAKFEHPQ
jgi:hypothetical protein